MTTAELTQLISAVGFPILLVGAGLWFFATKFWPWYVKRQAERDTEEDTRHAGYLAEMGRTRTVFEKVIQTLEGVIGKLDIHRQHEQVEHAEMLALLRGQRPSVGRPTDHLRPTNNDQ